MVNAAIDFHVKDVHYLENKTPETFEDWFIGRNICNDEALVNLQKFLTPEKKLVYSIHNNNMYCTLYVMYVICTVRYMYCTLYVLYLYICTVHYVLCSYIFSVTSMLHFFQFFRRGLGDFFVGVLYMCEFTIPFISARMILAQVSQSPVKLLNHNRKKDKIIDLYVIYKIFCWLERDVQLVLTIEQKVLYKSPIRM